MTSRPPDLAHLMVDTTVLRFCERALHEQWNVESDVRWDRLTLEAVPTAIRRAMGTLYSNLLCGESLGVVLNARLGERAPSSALREFTMTQLVDETRHTAFFTRVVERLGTDATASESLRQLHLELEHIDGFDELLLHAQTVEFAAQVLMIDTAKLNLARMKMAIRLPGSAAVIELLETIIRLVGRDEARHMAFGMHYLKYAMREMSPSARAALARRAASSCHLMRAAVTSLAPALATLGASPSDMQNRVWAFQTRQLGLLGIEIGEAPGGSITSIEL
jgi:ribonucleotide reductase beta subunit family protein with ferritin-like domain